MNFHYNQLCGALGMLKTAGISVNYEEVNEKLKRIAREHGPDGCDTDEVKYMHRLYRDLCLVNGLIQPGYLFDDRDCVPLV